MAARRRREPREVAHIADLTPDPENRREHNPRNIGMLVDSLHTVGAARSIVIDEAGVVLAGNGVLEAAAEAGITRVQVVEGDGETVIAVRRRGLTEEQKRRLAMYDNRVAELATWDDEQLARDAADGLDLEPFFFPNEIAAITRGGQARRARAADDARPAIAAGDVFALGRHRLTCGDELEAGDVERLATILEKWEALTGERAEKVHEARTIAEADGGTETRGQSERSGV